VGNVKESVAIVASQAITRSFFQIEEEEAQNSHPSD
jgi:hypothetical protein